MNTSEILAGLRDVQEPLAPEAALPWLLLANLLVAGLIVMLLLYRRWRARHAWRREALTAIRQAGRLQPEQARMSLAVTLRRIMLHLDGPQINGLSGDDWLRRLDDRFDTDWFISEGRNAFGDGLYAPCTLRAEELNSLCRRLIALVQALPVNSPSNS